jgi:hypothetical protein
MTHSWIQDVLAVLSGSAVGLSLGFFFSCQLQLFFAAKRAFNFISHTRRGPALIHINRSGAGRSRSRKQSSRSDDQVVTAAAALENSERR